MRKLGGLLPGFLLCVGVTLIAFALQAAEVLVVGQPYLEALVLAIILGVVIRSFWIPVSVLEAGIHFSAKLLLEFSVVLLGASISAGMVAELGFSLIIGIAAVVMVSLVASFAICRALGLSQRTAILIACGNSICGNSAIAAVAPVIGADSEDVASSIAFTAVLGVVTVLLLPLLVPILALTLTQYGVLAGLTVYAVPQVLAATLPIGALSNQVGTVVKLVRVLMLGPVVLLLSLFARRFIREPDGALSRANQAPTYRPGLFQLVPWFIIGFLMVATLRSLGLIPAGLVAPLASVASVLTTISMAALGLGVDVRVVAKAGLPVTASVTLSLLVLGLISYGLIKLVGV